MHFPGMFIEKVVQSIRQNRLLAAHEQFVPKIRFKCYCGDKMKTFADLPPEAWLLSLTHILHHSDGLWSSDEAAGTAWGGANAAPAQWCGFQVVISEQRESGQQGPSESLRSESCISTNRHLFQKGELHKLSVGTEL